MASSIVARRRFFGSGLNILQSVKFIGRRRYFEAGWLHMARRFMKALDQLVDPRRAPDCVPGVGSFTP